MDHPIHDPLWSTLAHQLKAPAATLEGASSNLRRSLIRLVEDLAFLGIGAPGDEEDLAVEAIGAVARCAAVLTDPAFISTGLEDRERLEEVAERLRAIGVEGDIGMAASSLLRDGWGGRFETIAPLLRHAPERGLGILQALARLRNAAASIEASARRVAGLGDAIRAVSGPDVEDHTDPGISLSAVVTQIDACLPPGVEIRLETCPVPRVRGRDDLLAEVWSNLINNAVQAMDGRGHVTVRTQVGEGDSIVRVSISNDGPGISPQDRERIFAPGVTTREATGGEGLGLPVARALLQRCGGTVTLAPSDGGATFEVTLQAVQAVAAQGAGSRNA